VNEYIPNYQYLARPADAFADICNSTGFEVIECVASERTYAFQNVNTAKSNLNFFPHLINRLFNQWNFFLDAIAAVNPFLNRIPVSLRERYLYDCLMEIQKLKVPSADGSTVASYRLMIAHIRRPYHELNSNNKWVDQTYYSSLTIISSIRHSTTYLHMLFPRNNFGDGYYISYF